MSQKRGAPNLVARHHRGETGDTLIEVLIAIVIISLSVVAVLGTLTETITSSAEHRSFTTLDGVLKNFAEAIKYDVQLQPASSSIYQDCAGQLTAPSIPVYRVVSTYPSTAAVGTGVTVFGTSFKPGATVSVTVGGTSVPAANFVSGSNVVKSDGTMAASFALPATAAGSQAVSVSDGTNTALSATALSVTPSTGSSTGSPVAGYSIGISSIGWWNSSTKAFDNSTTSTCSANDKSGIQEVNLVARAPSLASDSLSVVVTNPAFTPPNPAPAVSVVPSPLTPSAGQQIVFSANFTGSTGGTWPSGTVTWTFTNSPGNPTCNNSTLSSTGTKTSTTTCTVASALPGIYQVAATYSGDVNYSATAGYGSVTVPKSASSVGVNISPTNPILGNSLTFSATVTGSGNITPTGTVSWVFTTFPAGTSPTCNPSTLGGSGSVATTTAATNCVVPNAQVGTYAVTATYPGDSVYLSGSGTGSTTVRPTPITITSIVTANGSGGTVGRIDLNDTVTITFSGQINAHTVCSAWTNGLTTIQSASTGSVVTISNTGSGDNILSATGPSGCGTFNFGTIDLGTAQYVTGNSHKSVTFTNSTFAYNGTTHTLTITLGTKGGMGTEGVVSTSTLTLALSNSVLDSGNNALGVYSFTSSSGQQF